MFASLLFSHALCPQVTASPSPFFKMSGKEPAFPHLRKIERLTGNVRLPQKFENLTKQFPTSHISGGKNASNDVANSVAYLFIKFRSTPETYSSCTGSILTNWLILSAAHCFQGKDSAFDVSYVRVGLGKFGDKGKLYDVRYVDIFKKYNSTTLQNDLAIVWIDGKISFPFKPVSLPSPSFSLKPNTTVYAAGFGRTSASGPVSPVLLEAKLLHQSFGRCIKEFSYNDRKKMFRKQILCATTPNYPNKGTADTCPGDSGGPLYIMSGSEMQQHGITSFGTECGKPDSIGWYTNLKTYVRYIDAYIKDNYRHWKEVFG